jgi:acyl-CoA synthetase (AMP-forming)/AMP-acid ligase II
MRTFLLILLGAIITLVVLKMLSKQDLTGSGTGKKFAALAKTQQAANLIRTNEFRELVKTQEFRSLAGSLAEAELKSLSGALLNISV